MKGLPKNVLRNGKYSYRFPIYWNSYMDGNDPILVFQRVKNLYTVIYWENDKFYGKNFNNYKESKDLLTSCINHILNTKKFFGE